MLLTPGILMQANLPGTDPDGLPVCRFRGSKYRGNTASRAWNVNFNNGNCNNNDIDNNNNYVRAVR